MKKSLFIVLAFLYVLCACSDDNEDVEPVEEITIPEFGQIFHSCTQIGDTVTLDINNPDNLQISEIRIGDVKAPWFFDKDSLIQTIIPNLDETGSYRFQAVIDTFLIETNDHIFVSNFRIENSANNIKTFAVMDTVVIKGKFLDLNPDHYLITSGDTRLSISNVYTDSIEFIIPLRSSLRLNQLNDFFLFNGKDGFTLSQCPQKILSNVSVVIKHELVPPLVSVNKASSPGSRFIVRMYPRAGDNSKVMIGDSIIDSFASWPTNDYLEYIYFVPAALPPGNYKINAYVEGRHQSLPINAYSEKIVIEEGTFDFEPKTITSNLENIDILLFHDYVQAKAEVYAVSLTTNDTIMSTGNNVRYHSETEKMFIRTSWDSSLPAKGEYQIIVNFGGYSLKSTDTNVLVYE